MSETNFDRYVEACNYPGVVDAVEVERQLGRYLQALGVSRRVVQLRRGWELSEHPELERNVNLILDEFETRVKGSSLRVHERGERALHDFAAWCVQSGGWWWWRELSYVATTYLGAIQLDKPAVIAWSEPLFEAFIAGAWILHWTEEVLFWVAKPLVQVEQREGRRQLHSDSSAAIISDVEDLYFWHGVLVASHVVMRPELITVEEIEGEENVEVRRVLIERYGLQRYLRDSNATVIHEDTDSSTGDRRVLYCKEQQGDEPIVMVHVKNSTPEPDGSIKDYFIRVPPDIKTAGEAVSWTFGRTTATYAPEVQT